MNTNVDRREFNKRSAAMTGLFAGSLFASMPSFGDESILPENRLTLLGLNALARAHEKSYFANGHRGAAMISAQLLCDDNELDGTTRNRIAELFDLNWAKSDLCKPFPDADVDPKAIEKVGLALADGGTVLREVGHNVIFAMLAIKAFRMIPEAATTARVDGVCALIRAFKPWRDIEPDADVNPPPFSEEAAASKFILNEASAAIDRFIGFGQGFAGHMLTFGQSLVELAAMGDVEWAESCRTAFRKYVTVTRRGPDADSRRISDHPKSKLRPSESEYWKRRGDKAVGIGHVFKYPYGYYDLIRRADDDDLERKLDAKAYHLF